MYILTATLEKVPVKAYTVIDTDTGCPLITFLEGTPEYYMATDNDFNIYPAHKVEALAVGALLYADDKHCPSRALIRMA